MLDKLKKLWSAVKKTSIKEWIFTPIKKKRYIPILVVSAFGLNVAWIMGIIPFLKFLFYNDNQVYTAIFFGCIFAPLWEEFAFRVIPMWIAKGFGEKFIIPVVMLSSLIFGWGHGNGPVSLLIQGVGGLFLATVYIKSNYNYWAAVALHSIWNVWAIFLA